LINQNTPSRGTGILAMFVDLEPGPLAEFRLWLAEDMFAARLDIGFHACASYDLIGESSGQKHLTTYEMNSLGDLYGEPYQGLRRVRDPRDAYFHEQFQNPDRYTLAWTGPEISGGESGFAPFMHVDRFDLTADSAQAFNIWFVTEYLHKCQNIPGLVRLRRFLAMEGAPAHFVMHEFSNADFIDDPTWAAARNADQWEKVNLHPGGSASYRRVIDAILEV
jgi:hypothetical protein